MKKDIILLDGATGTRLWQMAEEAGVEKKPTWMYNIEHPEFLTKLALEYAEAGSDIIQANTFGANGPAVKRSSSYAMEDVVRAAVRTTKKALEGTGKKTCMSVGPLSMMLEPFGDLEEDECREIYEAMIGAGMEEKPEVITLETFMDIEMMKIAAEIARKYDVLLLATMTFEQSGRTLMGNKVSDIAAALDDIGVDAMGMNCSLGPEAALPIMKQFAECTKTPLVFKPNAGLPQVLADGTTGYTMTAEEFLREVEPALDFVSYAGGCCGSSAEFIRAMKALRDSAG